jgi:hypothetical protein
MDGPPDGPVRLIGGPLDQRRRTPISYDGDVVTYRLFSVGGDRHLEYILVAGSQPPQARFSREVPASPQHHA